MNSLFNADAFWIILTGSLVAVSSGLLGCYLLLRRMALIGDAISHAVLPGIAAAFLITGSLNSLPSLVGAATIGLACTWLIETVQKKAGVQGDAAMGIVFTFLFAVGVIMVSSLAGNADLDQECVLYGELAFVTFDDFVLGMPVSTAVLAANLLIVIAVIGLGYRGLFLTTFDPAFARALGISAGAWHYLLMSLVSLTTVVSFESVGAILVVAFLIGPAAIAHLLTDRMRVMLVISSVAGITASIGGYFLASALNANVAGSMTVVLGAEFAAVFLFGPKGVWRKKTVIPSSPAISPPLSP